MAENKLLADIYSLVNILLPPKNWRRGNNPVVDTAVESLKDLLNGKKLAKLLKCETTDNKPKSAKRMIIDMLNGFLGSDVFGHNFTLIKVKPKLIGLMNKWAEDMDQMLNTVVVIIYMGDELKKFGNKRVVHKVETQLATIKAYFKRSIDNLYYILRKKSHKFEPLVHLNGYDYENDINDSDANPFVVHYSCAYNSGSVGQNRNNSVETSSQYSTELLVDSQTYYLSNESPNEVNYETDGESPDREEQTVEEEEPEVTQPTELVQNDETVETQRAVISIPQQIESNFANTLNTIAIDSEVSVLDPNQSELSDIQTNRMCENTIETNNYTTDAHISSNLSQSSSLSLTPPSTPQTVDIDNCDNSSAEDEVVIHKSNGKRLSIFSTPNPKRLKFTDNSIVRIESIQKFSIKTLKKTIEYLQKFNENVMTDNDRLRAENAAKDKTIRELSEENNRLKQEMDLNDMFDAINPDAFATSPAT